MAKLFTMFLVLIAVQACLVLYIGESNEVAGSNAIWDLIMNVNNWGNLNFLASLVGVAMGIGLVGIAAASVFGFKTDFLLFGSMITGLIALGSVFISLFNTVRSNLISMIFDSAGCTLADTTSCFEANLVSALIVGPVALYYIWTVIEWWRGKDQ